MKPKSNIRVIFATTALGMGVDTPFVSEVIHITPPGNLESYIQEFGRAGRSGQDAVATLYYNNSDIAENKQNIDEFVREYCKLNDSCLRDYLVKYFGFKSVHQNVCCSICTPNYKVHSEYSELDQSSCNVSNVNTYVLRRELTICMSRCHDGMLRAITTSHFFAPPRNLNLVEEIISNLANIKNQNDLLMDLVCGMRRYVLKSSLVYKIIYSYILLKFTLYLLFL